MIIALRDHGVNARVLNVKAVVALVGAFSVITNLRMDLLEALLNTNLTSQPTLGGEGAGRGNILY